MSIAQDKQKVFSEINFEKRDKNYLSDNRLF